MVLALLPLDCRNESVRHSEALDAITRYLGLGCEAPQRTRARASLPLPPPALLALRFLLLARLALLALRAPLSADGLVRAVRAHS